MHNQNDNTIAEPLFMPFAVLRNKKLNAKQRLILAWIIQHEPCKADSQLLAKLISGSPRTALQTVRELKAAGYIIEIGNDGRGKTYKAVEGRLING